MHNFIKEDLGDITEQHGGDTEDHRGPPRLQYVSADTIL